jgi:hypothetical protein
MCVGCAATYAAIAASTLTYSMNELYGSEASSIVAVSNADLARAAAITTTLSRNSTITIKQTSPVVTSVATDRGVDSTAQQAI